MAAAGHRKKRGPEEAIEVVPTQPYIILGISLPFVHEKKNIPADLCCCDRRQPAPLFIFCRLKC